MRTRGSVFRIDGGIYAYVGSCGNHCHARITRHLSKVSNRFWHVDFLHDICDELGVVVLPYSEVDVARAMLQRFVGVMNFGNSDRRADKTHLFRVSNDGNAVAVLRELIRFIRGSLGKAY